MNRNAPGFGLLGGKGRSFRQGRAPCRDHIRLKPPIVCAEALKR
jgi:hypothetical protein